MNIPIKLKVSGHPKFTLTDIRDGSKQVIEQDNLLLDSFWDRYFTQSASFLSPTTMTTCLIGDGSVAPAVGDTGLSGATLASNSSQVTTKPLAARDRDRLPNPTGGLPPASGEGVAWSPSEQYLAVAHYNSPFVSIYKQIEPGRFVKLPNPSALPGGHAVGVSWSPCEVYLSVAHIGTPFVTVYERDGDTFTKISNPNVLPNISWYGDCAWRSDGQFLAVVHDNVPRLTIFKRDGDTLTKISNNPNVSPTGAGRAVSWTPDGQHLAVAHDTSPFLSVYEFDDVNETVTKLSNPSSLPGGDGRDVVWSPDGNYVSIACVGNSPNLFVYKKDGSTLAKIADPSAPPNIGLGGVSWSLDGTTIVANGYIVYEWIGETLIRKGNADVIPEGGINKSEWSPGGFNAVAHANSPRVSIYKPLQAQTPLSLARNWTFAAGVGTGTVSEVALRAGSTAAWNSAWVARIVLGTPLDKTEFHQLDVEWELISEYDNALPATGVIAGGQRDGVTDVTWKFEINEKQLYWLMADNAKSAWFGIGNTPRVHTGTSNDPIEILFGNSLQGEEIGTIAGAGVRTVEAYVPGSLEREFRLFFEVNQMNGDIGEVILEDTGGRYFGRITFDPPLDKPIAETHRLYLDVTLGMTRGV